MASNEYHFISEWKVKATCKEVYDIIADAESLSQCANAGRAGSYSGSPAAYLPA